MGLVCARSAALPRGGGLGGGWLVVIPGALRVSMSMDARMGGEPRQ